MRSTQRRGAAETRRKLKTYWQGEIIDAAIEVHRILGGPGLLESLYDEALYQELKLRDISVQAQVQIPVIYKRYTLKNPMRLDLLVGGKVIIEVKATEQEQAVHRAQVLTYLRLTRLKLGLLPQFWAETSKWYRKDRQQFIKSLRLSDLAVL